MQNVNKQYFSSCLQFLLRKWIEIKASSQNIRARVQQDLVGHSWDLVYLKTVYLKVRHSALSKKVSRNVEIGNI